jgi:hypothetical protein
MSVLKKERARRRRVTWSLVALLLAWLPGFCVDPVADLLHPGAAYHETAVQFGLGWMIFVTLPTSAITLCVLLIELVLLLVRGFSEEPRY